MRSLIIAWIILLPVMTVIAGIDITNGVSYGEIIAIAVTITGGFIALCVWFCRCKKERSRRNRLITYPNTWKAYRMLSKGTFEVWAEIDIPLPLNSCHGTLYVQTAGQYLKIEHAETILMRGDKAKRARVTGTTPLALLPADAKEVDVWVKITLDGDFSKKSKKYIVPITNHGVAPSIPDKEGYQS
ncbi:hypothetical protein ACFLXD_05245 [Chloroflexota bacterium]